MKRLSRILALALAGCLLAGSLSACGGSKKEAKLNIAYQYGMGYAPMIIVQEQNLISKHYGSEVEINWQVMNSGSAINESVTAGEIDIACMGIAPFITGVSKGIPYKLYSAMSAQPMGLNTTHADKTTLADFTADDKIALVSYGSIQHIMLGMACEAELGDPHALDQNIINMAHPDGMQSLLSDSVAAHLTTAPYYNMELEDETIHEIESVSEAFPKDCTILVAAATEQLFEENRELYDAVAAATKEAMAYIHSNPADVAALLCENEGVTQEVMESYLADPRCNYATLPQGVLEVAAFMERGEFAESVPTTLEEIYFPDLLDEAAQPAPENADQPTEAGA